MKTVFKVEWTNSVDGSSSESEWFTERDRAIQLIRSLEANHCLPNNVPSNPTLTEYQIRIEVLDNEK